MMSPKVRIRLKPVLEIISRSVDVRLHARCRGTRKSIFGEFSAKLVNSVQLSAISWQPLISASFPAGRFRKCLKSQSPCAENGYRNCICILSRPWNIEFRRIHCENCVFGEKIGDFIKTTVFRGKFFGRPIWKMPSEPTLARVCVCGGGGGGCLYARVYVCVSTADGAVVNTEPAAGSALLNCFVLNTDMMSVGSNPQVACRRHGYRQYIYSTMNRVSLCWVTAHYQISGF